ncbi:hypothetical protein VTO73DRAFT_8709 [Trametes versicolor]
MRALAPRPPVAPSDTSPVALLYVLSHLHDSLHFLLTPPTSHHAAASDAHPRPSWFTTNPISAWMVEYSLSCSACATTMSG